MVNVDARNLELEDRVVAINRVTKVVKGGRRLRFAALVVVGDHNGHVGFGTGKAQEVPEAIRKAVEDAKKNLIEVPMVGTTIRSESTRLNSSHLVISYAVFCLKKKKNGW